MSKLRPGEHLIDTGGLALQTRDARVQTARAILAIRRQDYNAAEQHLINAQRALNAIEAELPIREHLPKGARCT